MTWFFKGKGDDGTTTLKGGKRITKDKPIFDLIGTLDELSAHIGLAVSYCGDDNFRNDLIAIQIKLSGLMGIITENSTDRNNASAKLDDMVAWIEQKIEIYGKGQEKLSEFVFSGKNNLGAALDIGRTVARRSEREAVRALGVHEGLNQKVLPVLNRLSSLLFVMRLFAEKD